MKQNGTELNRTLRTRKLRKQLVYVFTLQTPFQSDLLNAVVVPGDWCVNYHQCMNEWLMQIYNIMELKQHDL